ncbi:MAG: fasciclin domain-containing protein [Candidatus Zixiibacteriota bacterium]
MKTYAYLCFAVLFLAAAVLVAPCAAQEGEDDELYQPMFDVGEEQNTESLPILATMVDYGSLTMFHDLLIKSGLADKLKGDGPMTVFAPDDAAFEQLKPEQLDKLENDSEYLKKVLMRHIVADKALQFGSEPDETTITTLGGDMVNIEVDEESVMIGKAFIIDEWLECSNGVIHVIDNVLLPPAKKNNGDKK